MIIFGFPNWIWIRWTNKIISFGFSLIFLNCYIFTPFTFFFFYYFFFYFLFILFELTSSSWSSSSSVCSSSNSLLSSSLSYSSSSSFSVLFSSFSSSSSSKTPSLCSSWQSSWLDSGPNISRLIFDIFEIFDVWCLRFGCRFWLMRFSVIWFFEKKLHFFKDVFCILLLA